MRPVTCRKLRQSLTILKSETVVSHLDSDVTWPDCEEGYLPAQREDSSSTVLKHLDSDVTWSGCEEDDLSALCEQFSSTVLKHLDSDVTWPYCQEDYLPAVRKHGSITAGPGGKAIVRKGHQRPPMRQVTCRKLRHSQTCISTISNRRQWSGTWPQSEEDPLHALCEQCSSAVLKHLDSDVTWPYCQEDDLSALCEQCSSTVLKHLDSDVAPGLRVKTTLFMPYLQAVTSRKLCHWHILTVTYLC